MSRKRRQKKNLQLTVILLSIILVTGALPGTYINAWATETVSENDASPEPITEVTSIEETDKEVPDVSENEMNAGDDMSEDSESEAQETQEDTVSDSDMPEEGKNVIVQELQVPGGVSVKDIFEVEIPTLTENNVFDYILDPQRMITATDAIVYGGAPFEEGATLFFENKEGEYALSSRSDLLQVTNRSTTPVRISVYANLTPAEGVTMVSGRDFADESTSMYLALVNEDGTEIPIGTGTEAVFVWEMKAAPAGIYSLEYSEETGEHEYVLAEGTDEALFDSVAFGLTGACNPDGDWRFISGTPQVTVTWKVEPIQE